MPASRNLSETFATLREILAAHSDDLVVTYKTNLNLPANSRCVFQLGLWCDVTAVGPRNGRWNRFVCNSQVQASANIPRIDVDVWPLV